MKFMRYFCILTTPKQVNTRLLPVVLLWMPVVLLWMIVGSMSCARSPQPARADGVAVENPGATSPRAVAHQPVAVRTTQVRLGVLQVRAHYLGQVRATRRATVLARSAGTLADLPLAEGEAVRHRQVVARLSTPDASARLARARAELSRAETERDYLCDRHTSDRALGDAGALPPNVVALAAKNCAVAQNAVTAAGAQVREVELASARSAEVAPFDGRIVRWLAEPGEEVMPGRPLLMVEDAAREVVVALTESDLARGLGVGSRAQLRLLDGQTHDAQIADLSADASGPGRTREATISLPAELASAWPGMSVDLEFIVAEIPDATAVPRDALHKDAAGHAIFLVLDDHLKRQPVTPGLASRGWVAVTPAPQPGTHVVVGAPAGLHDGQRVFAVADPASEPPAPPTIDRGAAP